MSNYFKDSVVLTYDALDHLMLATQVSCTNEYVKKYLSTGKHPPFGAICHIDAKFFPN